MWQAEFKLCLYPDNPSLSVKPEDMESVLSDMQLTGKNLGKNRFQVGDKFLSLLCFMGCSPNIELAPQADKPYCYIEIETPQGPHFVAGKNRTKLICSGCKSSLNSIPDSLSETGPFEFNCPECGHLINLNEVNWRKTAFIANSWIVVGNIYESEAVPDEKLLAALADSTGVNWKYAYIRNNNAINL